MSNLRRPSSLLSVAGLGGSLLVIVVGVAVLVRGSVAAVVLGSLLVTFGLTGVLAWASRILGARDAERARSDASLTPRPARIDEEDGVLHPRAAGRAQILAHAALALMGLWALVMIVLAVLRGPPGWLVLLVPWAVLVLGGPVLALAGRLTPGGVYVTPTRVVDVDRGARAAVALADVDAVATRPGSLLIGTRGAGAVTVQRLAGPWSRRPSTDPFVVETLGMHGGGAALADQVSAAFRGR